MKLLIVDDHALNLKLLRAQLELEGHEVTEAHDGVDALDLLERERFDGVVSDILMPRMDGYRLCTEVRSRPALAQLPFVLYTSTYNSPGDRQLAESLGADAYLSKPAPTARIVAAIVAARHRTGAAPAPSQEASESPPSMKQYNEVLIRKLEEKGLELERTHVGLLESQARLSGLIASAMDAIVAVDERRTIVLFNAAAGRMFRCDPDAAIGRPLNDFIPMRSRDAHDLHMAAIAEESACGRATGPREVSALRCDGTEFPIEANISWLRTSQGPLFTAFIRDVTDRHRAQSALQRSEAGLRRAQDVAQMAHAVVNVSGEVEEWSDSFATLIGVPLDRMPRTSAEWLEHAHPDDKPAVLQAAERVRREHVRVDVEYRLRRGDEWRRVRHVLEPLDDRDDGGGVRTFNTIQDVTAERQTQDKVRQLNRVYAVLSGINSLIVRATDRDQLLREACRILVETGGMAKAWIGMVDEGLAPVRIVAWAGAADAFFEDLQRRVLTYASDNTGLLGRVLASGQPVISNDIARDPLVIERTKLIASGSLSFSILPLVVAGRTLGVLSIHAPTVGFFDSKETELLLGLAGDISFALDHLLKSERITYLATHDPLTALPNRNLFVETLSRRLEEPARDSLASVVLLDLVRFRRINETLGRTAGDDLLQQIAARLHALGMSTARVGPDVFALLIDDRRSAGELARDFEHIAGRCFAAPFFLGAEEVRMGCRIGAAVFPGDGDTAETLMRNAEAALRRARATAEAVVFYAAGMNASANEALSLESRLRRAVEREEFVLHYQPKVRMGDRRICGVEALIRWQDPERGLIAPMRFIPVLEETGLIGAVGGWALRRALDDVRAWHDAGTTALRVAVNVSPLQLNQPGFADQIAAAVAGCGGDALELEITESVIMDDVDRKIVLLEGIRRLGINIAIDDFGTGYSSLAYISRLPITSLKIDRAFVAGMTEGPQGYIIVSSIIALAHALSLKVVAEGVETEEQARLLKLLACDEAQGYLFSKPLAAAQLLEFLRTHDT